MRQALFINLKLLHVQGDPEHKRAVDAVAII